MGKWFLINIISFLTFMLSLSYGQYYEITRFSDDNGLQSRMVRGTIQDDEGFLWIAGNNGLFRFDTQQFKSFYSPLKDSVGLRGNKIIAITQSMDKKLWVGVDKGLHYLENDKIFYMQLLKNPTDDQNYVLSLFEDSHQNLWVGTYGGLFVIEKTSEKVLYVSEINENISNTAVWGITQDSNGKILFATKNNIFISNEDDNFT